MTAFTSHVSGMMYCKRYGISRNTGEVKIARAYTIWIVNKKGLVGPAAAFTVKHELISWLKKREDAHRLSIYALRDGRQSRVRFYDSWVEVLPFEERQLEMVTSP